MQVLLFKLDFFDEPNSKNLIGKGVQGKVHLLNELKTKKQYAVKILEDVEDINVIFEKNDIINNLNYPTIVKIHGYIPPSINSPNVSIVMEYCPNKSVQYYLDQINKGEKEEKWNLAHKIIIILGISFGMEYLHSQKIVHRDLKPLNVLLDSNFYPKICDFGLAKNISSSKSITSNFGGTPLFTAPEVLSGDIHSVEDWIKADCYSFGMTIYSILFDKIPFEGEIFIGNPIQLYLNLSQGKRPVIEQGKISKSMEELINKCWSGKPKERPKFEEITKELLKETKRIIENKDIKEEEINEIEKFLFVCKMELPKDIGEVLISKGADNNFQIFKKEDFDNPNPNINLIGEGSFGAVYKLHEKKTGKPFAVKIIKSTGNDDEFINSINIQSRINFPTIIHLRGACFDRPLYIIFEYMENKTVQYYINQANEGKTIEIWNMLHKMIIILGISYGMNYLHSLQSPIVHRDLKPDNILLDSNFYPKICDFGISKIVTPTGTMTPNIGTICYRAPEIENENENYGLKADVFSFGLTIYSILYDRIPYSECTSDYQIYDLKINGHRPEFEPNVISKSMEQLIEKCWDQDPKARPSFETINQELLKEINEFAKTNKEGKEEIDKFLKFCKGEDIPYIKQLINQKDSSGSADSESPRTRQRRLQDNQSQNIKQNQKYNPNFKEISQKEIDEFDAKFQNKFDSKRDSKFTKLHFAAMINSKEIGEILISKGANINAIDIIYLNLRILFLIKII